MRRCPLRSPLFPYTTLFRSLTGLPSACSGLAYAGVIIGKAVWVRPGSWAADRKSTRLNSSHRCTSYAVFCLKKKKLPLVLQVDLEALKQRVRIDATKRTADP